MSVCDIEILVLEQVFIYWHRSCKYFGGKTVCKKNGLISTLDKVIYFKGTFFTGLQNLSSLHKIGWRSAGKNSPFFSNMLLLEYLATKISMVCALNGRKALSKHCYYNGKMIKARLAIGTWEKILFSLRKNRLFYFYFFRSAALPRPPKGRSDSKKE
jgi:hypothetical protein